MSLSLPAPRILLLALRPFSFTASVVPAVYGSLVALALRGRLGVPDFTFDVPAFVATLLGCMAVHAAANLINDYFDHRSGLDAPENFGAVNPLVRNLMTPAQLATEAAATFAIALGCAAYLIAAAGPAKWPLVALVAFGAVSAYTYTAPPFAFKNRGAGDLQVLLSFAALMVFGAYFVQAHALSWLPVLYALPIGFLVVDILHVNNLRDLPADRAAGITTLAIRLGDGTSKRLHHAYVATAYVSVCALVAFAHLSPWTLLVFAAVPRARALGRAVDGVRRPDVDPLIVVRTARFHALFGALAIAGLALGIVTGR